VNTSELNLFFEPKDRLRLTVGEDRSYHTVKPVWAAPQTQPERFLALLDGKEKEITTIPNPTDLPESSLKAVREELRRRYLTAQIRSILNAKVEFGATYWHVSTDRGDRDFVTQSLQENAVWMKSGHLLLIDVDGNRFEIPEIESLDERSRQILESIL
jgi:hypothetical protein